MLTRLLRVFAQLIAMVWASACIPLSCGIVPGRVGDAIVDPLATWGYLGFTILPPVGFVVFYIVAGRNPLAQFLAFIFDTKDATKDGAA